MQLHYIDRSYKPASSDVVVEYYVKPASGVSLETACENIAAESSIGTWTDISTLSPSIAKRLKPHVFSVSKTGEVKIAYPQDLFEVGNMPEILSSIAGNIFGMKALKGLRLQDISFSSKILNSFEGPKYGIAGIRKLLRVPKRPLCGTIIKPKVGLDEVHHAKVAYEAWMGGLDAVKDDENLSSMTFNDFRRRVTATLKLRDRAEKETGEKKVYFANVTAETEEMLRRARYVKAHGGEYVMIDIITAGWAALQTLREADLGLVIHAHRAGHAMFTEDPHHGMSMLSVAKLARLVGVDQIHIGAILGKMKGGARVVEHIGEEIEESIIKANSKEHVLEQKWGKIKPVFAVCSGGLHPGLVDALARMMGDNIIIQAGGGVHWHPKGTRYGAAGMRQAVDAVARRIPAPEYAKTHKELADALKKFGYKKPSR